MQLTQNALEVLKRRYLNEDETPEEMMERVAKAISKNDAEYYEPFLEMLQNLEFVPGSPTLSNAGLDHGSFSSCFVLPISDSMDGIMTAVKQAAKIFQSGGGVGYSFSNLRPRGSSVSSGKGVASGPVDFMRMFDTMCDVVKQGGMRRGAQMSILRVDHPDIIEFINCKQDLTQYTNFNISVHTTEQFMTALNTEGKFYLHNNYTKTSEEVNAKEIFNTIVTAAWATGDPGLLFLDRVNELDPLGGIEACNPCVTGDSLIPTSKGLVSIKKLCVGDSVCTTKGLKKLTKVYNNKIQPILEIITKEGFRLKTTLNHKFYTNTGDLVEAQQLKVGMLLQLQTAGTFSTDEKFPINVSTYNVKRVKTLKIPDVWTVKFAEFLGFLTGDGWLGKGAINISLGLDQTELLKIFKLSVDRWSNHDSKIYKGYGSSQFITWYSTIFANFLRDLGYISEGASKKVVPSSIYGAPKKIVAGFLRGLFSADGSVWESKDATRCVSLTSSSHQLAIQTQLLLLQFGIKSKVYKTVGGKCKDVFEYTTKAGVHRKYSGSGHTWHLYISGPDMLLFEQEINFILKRKKLKLQTLNKFKKYAKKNRYLATVQVINKCPDEVVYDFTEPETLDLYANGLCTLDCGEQGLASFDSCNLGSIDLSKLVVRGTFNFERFKELINLGIRFLDNVITENKYPLPQIDEVSKANRRLGLSVMGFADCLIKLGIRYDSNECLDFIDSIGSIFKETSTKASEKLAEERGAFPNQKYSKIQNDLSIRNVNRTTIVPSGTVSIIAGTSSSIEPLFAIAFERVHDLMNGKRLTEFHPEFKKIIVNLGLDESAIINEIFKHKGSIQNIENLPQDVKDLFRTAHDITPEWHVRIQAQWQKYIDNAISKTINMSSEVTKEDVATVYKLAYKLGCKGITVFRDGCRGGQQVLTTVKDDKHPKKRPDELKGFTRRVKTEFGNMYVTVNEEDGKPFEVFADIGKSGSVVLASAETVGRLVSLALRSDISVRAIVGQLKGIGGGQPVFEKGRVIKSIADGVAYVLEMKYLDEKVEIKDIKPPLFNGCDDCL